MKTPLFLGPTPKAELRLQLCRIVTLEKWNLASTAAPFWRCYCPYARGGRVILGGSVHPFVPGKALIIPPNTPAHTELGTPLEKAYAHFTWRFRRQKAMPGVYEVCLLPAHRRALRALRRAAHQDAPEAAGQLNALMLAIVGQSLALLPSEVWHEQPHRSPEVERSIRVLMDELATPPSNADLAAAVGIHTNSFVRRFTREVGVPPQKFGMRLRLTRACELLTETDKSLEQVAEECGFWDRNHFTRAFTRLWQTPPAAFRKQNRL